MVAPNGSPGPPEGVDQLFSVRYKASRVSFSSSALQPAKPCIGPAWHSHPENHVAICSDAVERLAPASQHEVESGYQVAPNGSEGFPVICGPAAASSSWTLANGVG